MGPENKEPVKLYLTDPETGALTEIPSTIAELTVSDSNPDESMIHLLPVCYSCGHSDTTRQHGDCIRCKRWSQWVSPDHRCGEHTGMTLTIPLKNAPRLVVRALPEPKT